MVNPIVISFFYLGFAFSVILCKSWIGFLIYLLSCIILITLNKNHIKSVYKHIKPFILFFPIMIIIYLFISFVFTNSTWLNILNDAGFAIGKLLLLVIVMALYLEIIVNKNIILSVRSIWIKMNLKWKIIDDLFMFLELTFRFYPAFQREWQTISRSKKALGLTSSITKWEQIKSVANDLPGIILQSYRKAEGTALVIEQRGYGNQIPRGIANPVLFKLNDLILLIMILFGYSLLNIYVSL